MKQVKSQNKDRKARSVKKKKTKEITRLNQVLPHNRQQVAPIYLKEKPMPNQIQIQNHWPKLYLQTTCYQATNVFTEPYNLNVKLFFLFLSASFSYPLLQRLR